MLGFGLFILEELKADVTHEWMHGVVVLTKLISRLAYLSTATTLMTDVVWSHILLAIVADDVYRCLTALWVRSLRKWEIGKISASELIFFKFNCFR